MTEKLNVVWCFTRNILSGEKKTLINGQKVTEVQRLVDTKVDNKQTKKRFWQN